MSDLENDIREAAEAILNQPPPPPHQHLVSATHMKEAREGKRDVLVCFECGAILKREHGWC